MWFVPILVAGLGQAPRVEAADLVNRLASARYADRDAASSELEVMGTEALPALRAASTSTDPDLRTRVESLLAKIQSAEMTRAAPVRLDIRDRACDDFVAGSLAHWPNRLAWHPDTPEPVKRKKMTIVDQSPVPFWSAIDRLCQAGDLHYIPGAPGGPGAGVAQFRLFLAPGVALCPRADFGPLRFELTGLSHFRSVNLIPNARSQSIAPGVLAPHFGETHANFNVAMRVLVEPRMLISRIGQAVIAEAIDDRGQSLLPGDKPWIEPSASGSIPAQACTFIRLSLQHPTSAGKSIKRLRMTLPVEVVARTPGPLVVDLARARGRVFRLGHTSLEVLDIKKDNSGRPSIELRLTMDEDAAARLTRAVPLESSMVWGQLVRSEVSDNVIQVFDQQGRQFPWSGAGDYQALGSSITARLTLCPEGSPPVSEPTSRGVVDAKSLPAATPAQLHYHELARAVVRASVAFYDIPLP